MIIAWASDKFKHRLAFAVLPILVTIAGFGMLLSQPPSAENNKTLYAALFLVAMGCYSAMPIIVCWFVMNLGGHHRRAVGSAWQVGFGNTGGIIAVFAFLTKDAPRYVPGYSICIAFCCFSLICIVLYGALVSWENSKRERATPDLGLTAHEKTEMGDLSPDYRYLL